MHKKSACARKPIGCRALLRLDCSVIERLHAIREANGDQPIDTVSGIFLEGRSLYENSGFYEKTHIQLCVSNPACIKGVFRVSDGDLI